MAHVCPGELCESVIDDAKLGCPAHWRMVPKEVQERVLDTWRSLRRGEGTLASYKKARDEAVSHMGALGG